MRALCDIRPQKTETHKKILTTGGNLIYCLLEVNTPASDLTTMKLRLNSAISGIKSQYMRMDVKYFHLNNHMDRVEQVTIPISMITQ